jgi:hypothetical protein
VCEDYGVKSIEKVDGGYGKGYIYALSYWRQFIDQLVALNKNRCMAVILIAHAKVEKFEDPEASPYDRYSPRLHKHAGALITEWCDAVLFATRKFCTQTEETGFGRKRTTAHAIGKDGGERVRPRSADRPVWRRTATTSTPNCRSTGTLSGRHHRRGDSFVTDLSLNHHTLNQEKCSWSCSKVSTPTGGTGQRLRSDSAGKYVAVITESEVKANKAANGRLTCSSRSRSSRASTRTASCGARLNLDNPNATAVKIAAGRTVGHLPAAVGVMAPNDSVELHDLPLVISVKCKKRKDSDEITNEIKGYAEEVRRRQARPQATTDTPPWRRAG